MPIGGKIRDEINAGIRLRDKLLLILSEHSIKSNWVEDEIEQAFEEEQKRDQVVLFPVCLDEEVKTTAKAWASKLRRARHIGDFTRWKDHDARS
jgi:TIR domain